MIRVRKIKIQNLVKAEYFYQFWDFETLTPQKQSSERNLQGTIVPHRPSFKVILHPFKHKLSPEGAIVPGELSWTLNLSRNNPTNNICKEFKCKNNFYGNNTIYELKIFYL